MTISEEKLREILAGCEGVTPGPWFTTGAPWFRSEDGVMAGSPDGNIGYLIADCEDAFAARDEYTGPFKLGDKDADAAHIARLDPQTISSIITELMAAREALRPDPGGWTYSINYGPDGEQDWANLTTPEGRHVSNIRTHDAIRICAALNAADALPKAIDAAEQAYIGAFWMLGKGRVSAVEKLYGFQILFGTEEIIASGEGDTPQDAIRAALELREKNRG